jgi:hypothetical protein
MAFHNTNWASLPMTAGTYTVGDLGDGLTASTVHSVFCLSDGIINISAMGGGNFTWDAKSGNKIDVVCARIVVSSGSFVGFKTAFQPNYIQSLRG